jgi:hypothetical protein
MTLDDYYPIMSLIQSPLSPDFPLHISGGFSFLLTLYVRATALYLCFIQNAFMCMSVAPL